MVPELPGGLLSWPHTNNPGIRPARFGLFPALRSLGVPWLIHEPDHDPGHGFGVQQTSWKIGQSSTSWRNL